MDTPARNPMKQNVLNERQTRVYGPALEGSTEKVWFGIARSKDAQSPNEFQLIAAANRPSDKGNSGTNYGRFAAEVGLRDLNALICTMEEFVNRPMGTAEQAKQKRIVEVKGHPWVSNPENPGKKRKSRDPLTVMKIVLVRMEDGRLVFAVEQPVNNGKFPIMKFSFFDDRYIHIGGESSDVATEHRIHANAVIAMWRQLIEASLAEYVQPDESWKNKQGNGGGDYNSNSTGKSSASASASDDYDFDIPM